MENLDNPAGRLHALLSDFARRASDQNQIVRIWAAVFDVGPDEALPLLCRTAGLIEDIERAVDRSGHPLQQEVVRQFSRAWLTPVLFPEHHGFQTPSAATTLVDPAALSALGGLSAFLSATQHEGTVPPEDERTSLGEKLDEAEATVRQDESLPEDIRRVLLDHIHAMRWALANVRFDGPAGVRTAGERLAGTVAMSTPEVRTNRTVRRVLTAVGAVYAAFQAGPAVQKAIDAWKAILEIGP